MFYPVTYGYGKVSDVESESKLRNVYEGTGRSDLLGLETLVALTLIQRVVGSSSDCAHQPFQ